jgi:hypothetical protein
MALEEKENNAGAERNPVQLREIQVELFSSDGTERGKRTSN